MPRPKGRRFPAQRFTSLTPEQAETLTEVAKEDSMSESEVLREAFAAYVKARSRRLKRAQTTSM